MTFVVKLAIRHRPIAVILLGIFVLLPRLSCAVTPELSAPEVRMGLENYYASTGTEDLLSREQVKALADRLDLQLQCIEKKLPAEYRMPQQFAKMHQAVDLFKSCPYSANLAANFYIAHTLSQSLAIAVVPKTPALTQCLAKEPLLPQLSRHIDLLSYAADIALASENYPGGRAAFFASLSAPKKLP